MEINSPQFYIVCALAALIVLYLITLLTRNRPSIYIETEGLRIDIDDCHLDEEKVANIISYAMLHSLGSGMVIDPKLTNQSLDDRDN